MHRSGDIFRFEAWNDTLLIGPCAAFGSDVECDWDNEHLARSRLRAMRADPGAMAMLRSAAEHWGFAPPNTLPHEALIERVAAEAADRRLTALVMPTGDARIRRVTWGSGWPIHFDEDAPNPFGLSPERRLAWVLTHAVRSHTLTPPGRREMAQLLEPGLLPDAVALILAWADLGGARWEAILGAFLDAGELDGDVRTAAIAATELDTLLEVLSDDPDGRHLRADIEDVPDRLARLVELIGAHTFVGTLIREIDRGVHPTPSVVPKASRAPRREKEPPRLRALPEPSATRSLSSSPAAASASVSGGAAAGVAAAAGAAAAGAAAAGAAAGGAAAAASSAAAAAASAAAAAAAGAAAAAQSLVDKAAEAAKSEAQKIVKDPCGELQKAVDELEALRSKQNELLAAANDVAKDVTAKNDEMSDTGPWSAERTSDIAKANKASQDAQNELKSIEAKLDKANEALAKCKQTFG